MSREQELKDLLRYGEHASLAEVYQLYGNYLLIESGGQHVVELVRREKPTLEQAPCLRCGVTKANIAPGKDIRSYQRECLGCGEITAHDYLIAPIAKTKPPFKEALIALLREYGAKINCWHWPPSIENADGEELSLGDIADEVNADD